MSPLFNAVGASNGFINARKVTIKTRYTNFFYTIFSHSVYKQVQKTASICHYLFVSIEKRCSIVTSFM